MCVGRRPSRLYQEGRRLLLYPPRRVAAPLLPARVPAQGGNGRAVTVYLAWTSEPISEAPGPWEDWREIGERLVLLESVESLSTVYHAVKWLLPDGAALLVSAVESPPKGRGLAPGATAWLRERVARPR